MNIIFDTNGLIVSQEQLGSGTGNYNTFLRLHDTGKTKDGVEVGFNTGAGSETLTGSNPSDMLDSFTSALKLSDVPVVTINGVEYLQFGLDTNETSSLISVTEFKIYQAATGTVSSQASLGAAQFDMDAGASGNQTISLTDYGSGSGASNFAFYVPKSSFDTSKEYIYLFSKLTNVDGGFEEWGVGAVAQPDFEIDKTVDKATVDGVDSLTYTVTVANTGNTELHVNIADPGYAVGLPAGDTDSDGVLDVGETWAYTFNRSVSQNDIDQGADLSNTVTVTTEAGSKSDTVTTSVQQNPSMSVTKTVDESSVDQAGQAIHYSISVTNDGNVTLAAPTVTDANAALGAYTGDDGDGQLEVGETWVYSATHEVTQEEMDLGGAILNTASASSGTIHTQTPTSGDSNQVSTAVQQNPSMLVTKTVEEGSVDQAGQTIHYSISVKNDGNVTLNAPTLADANAEVGSSYTGDDDNDGLLDVGETWTFAATHEVTQEELDLGGAILNTASASSDTIHTQVETSGDSNEVSTTVVQNASMSVTKTVEESSVDQAGQTIHYSISVKNDGNVTLNAPTLADANAVLGSYTGDDDSDGLLDVGETWTFAATHEVTQEELDLGGAILNTASASSDTIHTQVETSGDSNEVSTTIVQNASMSVTKTAEESSVDQAGQTIHYSISVKNDGNVTLNAPTLADANAEVGSSYTGDDDNDGLLDVGETWTFAATHEVTQEELDLGGAILNTASASSDTIHTQVETSGDSNEVSTTVVQNPTIEIVKALNPFATGGSYAHTDGGNAPIILVGDKGGNSANTQLSWQYTVTNTGNVTLKDVGASDDVLGTISLLDAGLAPDAVTTGTATETATNVAGLHTNTATASGTPKYGTTAVTDADTGAYVGAQGDIVIDKQISVDNGLTWSQGPVVAFQGLQLAYKVTVTDNSDSGLSISAIGVTDSQVSAVTGVASSLAHGASDASNVYTGSAVGAGGTNVATVTATVSDAYGHSMSLSDTDSVSYTTVQALAGLSKGYWANHAWDARIGSGGITLGDSDGVFGVSAGDKYAITFDKAGALAMDNSSTSGDARIILGGQLVAAQLNTYMTGTTAKGLVDAGAKWFNSFGLQDDNTGYNAVAGAKSATGMTVSASEWANDKKNGFTFKEGAAVSTSGDAWKKDLFSFEYTSQVDGEVHKVGVTGEGLKNALAAYDHGISGTDGLVLSQGGGLIAWQKGADVFFQYDNTSNDTFWGDLKGGAFLKVLNDAELAGKISIVGIHDDHGNLV